MTGKRSDGTISHRRVRQPWPQDKLFKILSIDGGGIKGIFPAGLLKEIEAELCNGYLRDYFDMIAGTSTGGILAIGLSATEKARDLYDLYLENGEKIFPKPKKPILSVFGTLHDRKPLEKMVKETLGKKLFGECRARMVIPAVNQHGEPTIYKTDHHPDYKRDHSELMARVALDTSAAPIYLGGNITGEEYCVDGGLFANNPIMCAVVDALACYEIEPSQIRVLSIGCGKYSKELSVKKISGGISHWKDILDYTSQLQSHNVYGQAGLLIGRENILRIDPELNSPIALDDYGQAKARLPKLAKTEFARNEADLVDFFDNKVECREHYYCER